VILVDRITKSLFVNRYATPGELVKMSYRELLYFHDAMAESLGVKKE
jgi:hypothetical protein